MKVDFERVSKPPYPPSNTRSAQNFQNDSQDMKRLVIKP